MFKKKKIQTNFLFFFLTFIFHLTINLPAASPLTVSNSVMTCTQKATRILTER